MHARFVKTVHMRDKNPKSLQMAQPVPLCVCAHRCVHSCTCTICDNSVRNKNPVTASGTSPDSVRVCVCVCAQVCTYIHAHVRFVKTV